MGTDAGVFYKDATMTVWQPFNNGLPNVWVSQIDIYYVGGTASKIRASTFGRGIWESDPYVGGTYPPIANFVVSGSIGCPGVGVQYNDYGCHCNQH